MQWNNSDLGFPFPKIWYLLIGLIYALQISVADFTRDRKMMSVLCSRNQLQIMFSKGAPESIISRCTNILCNDDGSTIPLTTSIRAELESRFHRLEIFCSSLIDYVVFYVILYN